MATELPAISLVLNDETVFRAVRDDSQLFSCDGSGALVKLSSSAFNDRELQPSVDRDSLRLGGASESRKSDGDGVVALRVLEVRAIRTIVTFDHKARPLNSHDVDVLHNPLVDNHSHALVKTAPALASPAAFKKLKEALSRLAELRGWAFPPGSMRNQ